MIVKKSITLKNVISPSLLKTGLCKLGSLSATTPQIPT